MPSFSKDHHSSALVKAMIVGESKSGKTGLLASLANSPDIDRIAIFDFDNGLDVLGSYLAPEAAKKIFYSTFDRFDSASYDKARQLMKNWKTPTEELGPLANFTERDVVVMDSGTFFGDACMEAAKRAANIDKDTQIPQPVWGDAQVKFMKVVDAWTGDKLKCNVIWNTHIRIREDDIKKTMRGFPETVGSKLSGRIARSFNNLWRIDVKTDGKRVIRTAADAFMTLGSSAPTALAVEEEFDLAKVFSKIRSQMAKLQAA